MSTNKPSLQMYDQLYLKTGIRVASQLMQARAIPQEKFALPKGSIYHYVDPQGSTIGPLPADSLFAAFPKNLFVTYVQSFYPDNISKAKYRVLPGLWDEKSPSTEIKHYHHVNKRMRRVVSFDQTLMDINAPLIISYARIPKHYEYMDNMYRKLYQWEDLYNTVFRKIQEVNDNKFYPNTRHQFISIEVPGVLVPYSFIESSIKQGITTTHMPKIGNDGQRLMTHLLWMFSNAKDQSVFRHLDTKTAHNITLLFTYAGKVAVLNYGMLLSMCENKDYDSLYYKKKTPMLEVQMRKYLYLMYMNLIGQTQEIDEGEEVQAKADSNNNLEQAIKLTEEADLETAISNEIIAAIDEAISDSENLSEVKVITTLEKQPVLESVSKAFEKQVQRAIATGAITSSKQIAAINELSNKFEEIKLSDGKTLKEAIKIKDEDKVISPKNIDADITTITDPSMHFNNVETIHHQYVSKIMRPHILSSIVGIQRAGILVEDIKEEDVSDVTGETTHISVSLKPIVGKKSTVHMKIPKVKEDGTFTVNGTTYRLSNQLSDAPIRKVSQNKVVLSSAYGRAFITTGDYARNNYTTWLCDSIMSLAQDDQSNIKAISIGDCTDQTKSHSKAVSSIKNRYRLIQTKDYTFYFDDELAKISVTGYPRSGHYWCGIYNKDKSILIGLDKNDYVYIYDKTGKINTISHIEEVLGLDRSTRPVEYAMFNTAGVELPLGIVLASIYGMDNLMNMLSSEIRKIPRSLWNKEPISLDEWYLDFADTRMVFKNSDRITEIIMGGFSKYHKSIKEHELEFFDKAGSFATMLSKTNMGSLADSEIRNIRFMDDMFVDPITEELLTIMKEPTSFRGLLYRSAELLSTGDYTREFMLKGQMRISGYERFSMVIYKELTNAARMQARSIGRQNKPISLNPNSVWMNITSDPAKSVVNDINPIEYLKGAELLTFSGHGGRSKETMVASTRLYDESYMGVVSEATVDSGDVGIRSYLCVNPDIKDIYGFTGDKQDFKPTSVYSTSALLFANSDKDDAKRTGFISIQNAHLTPTIGYEMPMIRTGMESAMAFRLKEPFIINAEKDCTITSVSPMMISVKYNDNTKQNFKLGYLNGKSGGLTVAHKMVSNLKAGDKLRAGMTIAYNESFFCPDWANPGYSIFKIAKTIKVCLPENENTIEDSMALSDAIGKQMAVDVIIERAIVVNFDQAVTNTIKISDSIFYDSVLCYVTEQSAVDDILLDSAAIEQLKRLGAHAPRAKAEGVLESIVVYYNGELSDMSPSLRKICKASDDRLADDSKSSGGKIHTGQVTSEYRVKAEPLASDTAVIMYRIIQRNDSGTGEKYVLSSQLKTTVGNSYKAGSIKTEDGEDIDAIFGVLGISNRIVNSPYINGSTNTLVRLMTKKALEAYDGK